MGDDGAEAAAADEDEDEDEEEVVVGVAAAAGRAAGAVTAGDAALTTEWYAGGALGLALLGAGAAAVVAGEGPIDAGVDVGAGALTDGVGEA